MSSSLSSSSSSCVHPLSGTQKEGGWLGCCWCGMDGNGEYPVCGEPRIKTVTIDFPSITNSGVGACGSWFCNNYQSSVDLPYIEYIRTQDQDDAWLHECTYHKGDLSQEGCDGGEEYPIYNVTLLATCWDTATKTRFSLILTQPPDLLFIEWSLIIYDEPCSESPLVLPYSQVSGGPPYYNCWSGYTGSVTLSW